MHNTYSRQNRTVTVGHRHKINSVQRANEKREGQDIITKFTTELS